MKPILAFTGNNRFLCNFTPNTQGYSVEHNFQAAKSLDSRVQNAILGAKGPGIAKALGKRCKLRPDWEQVKDEVMWRCLVIKFGDPLFRRRLLGTGDALLVEGNDWDDTYWGVCDGVGKNMLGKMLMELRTRMRNKVSLDEAPTNLHEV